MNRGQAKLLVIFLDRSLVLRIDIGQKRKLRKKIFDGLELIRKRGQSLQVLRTRKIVGIILFQVLVVTCVNYKLDHLRSVGLLVFQLRHCGHELSPWYFGLFGNGFGATLKLKSDWSFSFGWAARSASSPTITSGAAFFESFPKLVG